ncbi:phytochrome B [Senna tora]|uniref:Phytochrome B n=1 Tax=Senna tora TaxID=362788 RepID=A0A834W5Q7_9FABA|nr:phytochrome B [Senna tora]
MASANRAAATSLPPPRLLQTSTASNAIPSSYQTTSSIQPFGCVIAVDDPSFRVLAYSDNARDLFGITAQSVLTTTTLEHSEALAIGSDVRTLFSPFGAALLEKAFNAEEVARFNPIWIHARTSGRPFYAILHRIDVGVVIDLEPARTEDPAVSIAGLVQSQKLAGRAISRLQQQTSSFSDGVVESVRELTGCTPFPLRNTCELLMQAFGLQLNVELQLASQLKENRVLRTQTLLCDMLLRDSPTGILTQTPSIMDLMKCDGAAFYYQGNYYPLGVTPTESQVKDIIKWLKAFHTDSSGLSIDSLADAGYPGAASLGDAVCGMTVAYVTEKDFLFWFKSSTKKEIRWGGARHQPEEERDDGEIIHPRSSFKAFLEVVKGPSFALENVEMNAINSLQFILQDSVRESEDRSSKSVGYKELRGLEDLSFMVKEMVRLIETATVPVFAVDLDGHINGWNAKVAELTGLSVEEAMGKSLVHDLVYKESEETVDRLLSRALRGEEDKNVEIKMRTFGPEHHKMAVFIVVNACSSKNYMNNIVGVCFIGQDVTSQKVVMDKLIHLQGDYKAIVHSPSPLIPPIFASDDNTYCSEWNTAMEKLTGWPRGDVIGKLLIGEVFGKICRLKGPNALTKLLIILHNVLDGHNADKFPLLFLDRHGNHVQALLTAKKRVSIDGQTIGAFCFLQIASPELQEALKVQRQQEKHCFAAMKELAYVLQEIKNPLNGIRFTNSLLEGTVLSDDQNEFVEASAACEKQMFKIMQDIDLQSIEDGSLELEKEEFLLGNVINAVVSQVMLLLRERNLQLIRDIPEEVKTLAVFGDQMRIQQVLADFLMNMVRYASASDGWVELHVGPRLKQISDRLTLLHAKFRMACPGEGLPPELIQDMFHSSEWRSQEGLGLSMSRKIVKLMNGEVQYIREAERCYFLIILELPLIQWETSSKTL